MLLSMQMILNRLENLPVRLMVNEETDRPELMSARMAYAPNCVQVGSYSGGICCKSSSGNRFLIEDIGLQEGFEIIQGIFDFYNKWEADILQLAAHRRFQEVVDTCHPIFHNPIVVFDANYRAVAMSSCYGEDDVDPEWKYLKRNGFNSVDAVKLMKYASQGIHVGLHNEPHLVPAIEGYYSRIAGIKLYVNDDLCGRLVIHEKDRPINYGDLQVMTHLQGILSPCLLIQDPSQPDPHHREIFSEIIITGKVERNLLEKYISYLGWTDTNEFRLVLIRADKDNLDNDIYHQLRRTILKMFPLCAVSIVDDYLAVIFKAEDMESNPPELLRTELRLGNKACIGVSLPIRDLAYLNYYFSQTTYAIEAAICDSPDNAHSIIYAFQYMIRYMIQSSGEKGLVYACHPDILKLKNLDTNTVSDYISLLRCYLDNERNMSSTAKSLYMHRNTLVYRLEKLNSILTADLDDAYERNYLRLSIYVTDIYDVERYIY